MSNSETSNWWILIVCLTMLQFVYMYILWILGIFIDIDYGISIF